MSAADRPARRRWPAVAGLAGRRPTARQAAIGGPLIVAAVVLGALLIRAADVADIPNLEAPDGFVAPPPPTSAAPAVPPAALAGVDGTTTTMGPANVGSARLAGTVVGPTGAVGGAVVRVERILLDDSTQIVDVAAGADGRWEITGIGGGRYRVRAFLAPTFAQTTAAVFFLADGEDRALDLDVDGFADPRIRVASAPVPPLVDQQLNVVVLVSDRVVDADGIVRTAALPGVSVTVRSTGPLVADGASTSTSITDASGQATFTFSCGAPTAASIIATASVPVPGAPAPAPTTTTPAVTAVPGPGEIPTATTAPVPVTPTRTVTATVDLGVCVVPAPPTTVPSTTIPGDSGDDDDDGDVTTTTVSGSTTSSTAG